MESASKSARTCGYCKEAGHYTATCTTRKADYARMKVIDMTVGSRSLTPDKHPAHWERLKAARAEVAEQLNAALDELSERALAVKHIRAALALLEKIR